MIAYTIEDYLENNVELLENVFDMGAYTTHYVSTEIYDQVGWKIHLSSIYDESGYLLEIVNNACKSIPINYKFISSYECYIKANNKQQNKIITIYPTSDEEALNIVTIIKSEFEKYNLTDVNIDNDFKISNNIYTRFCHFNDDTENSRYLVGIPNTILTKYIENYESYMYPFEKLYYRGVELPKRVCEINNFLKSVYVNSYEDILKCCENKAIIYLAWEEFNSYVNNVKSGESSSKFELYGDSKPFEINDLKFEQIVFEKTEKRFWKDKKDLINNDEMEEMKKVLIEHDEQKMLEIVKKDRLPYLFYYMKYMETHYKESMTRYKQNVEIIIKNVDDLRSVAWLINVPVDSKCFDYLKLCNDLIEEGVQKSELKFDSFEFVLY